VSPPSGWARVWPWADLHGAQSGQVPPPQVIPPVPSRQQQRQRQQQQPQQSAAVRRRGAPRSPRPRSWPPSLNPHCQPRPRQPQPRLRSDPPGVRPGRPPSLSLPSGASNPANFGPISAAAKQQLLPLHPQSLLLHPQLTGAPQPLCLPGPTHGAGHAATLTPPTASPLAASASRGLLGAQGVGQNVGVPPRSVVSSGILAGGRTQ